MVYYGFAQGFQWFCLRFAQDYFRIPLGFAYSGIQECRHSGIQEILRKPLGNPKQILRNSYENLRES